MAKTNRVVPERQVVEEVEDQPESVVDSGVSAEVLALNAKVNGYETRIDALDIAMLELAGSLRELQSLLDRVIMRLDQEKDLRVNAHSHVIANMDQMELSLRVLDICMNKYLDSEANAFDRLAEDPSIARSGMKSLIKVHKNLVAGIEHALRVS